MNEKHVVSLEMAKRLVKEGWDKKTTFFHINYYPKKFPKKGWHIRYIREIEYDAQSEIYSSPLISELLEELTNNEIMDYTNKMEKTTQGEFMNIFRNPDRLAEIWLEAKGEK